MQILIAGVTVAGKSARIVTDKQERSLTIGNAIREIREIRG
jgi:NAD(P)H-hydrate repair Nnr-like enzyme with NAD(P)H-hydrate dehydratase domain